MKNSQYKLMLDNDKMPKNDSYQFLPNLEESEKSVLSINFYTALLQNKFLA